MIRLAKAICSLMFGLYAGLVAYGNVLDYDANYELISKVLSMDGVPDNSPMQLRAVRSTAVHHAAYRLIIAVEAIIGGLCTFGGLRLLDRLRADDESFQEAKRASLAGYLAGLLLWFGGFQAIGGEWFRMWQARKYDATADAARLTQTLWALLIFLTMRND